MKMFNYLLKLSIFLFLLPLTVEANEEEYVQISSPQQAFFIYFKGNNTQPNPSELELYISTFYPNEYRSSRQNEFEWRRLQTRILEEINREINNLNANAIFIVEINAVVGNYDFENEGFPISLSRDQASFGWETRSFGNSIYVDIGGRAGTFGGLRVALFLNNLNRYNFAKISQDEAGEFLDNRNNLYNEYGHKIPLYRSVTLVTYFRLGNFNSEEYRRYLRGIPGEFSLAIPGIIDNIEVWDLASLTSILGNARNTREYRQIGYLIMDR